MPPPPPPTSITLKVKLPPGYLSGGADEYALGSIPVSTTIGAVRQQIQHIVPSHPTPEKQRLLYGGRALVDNEQTLADALNTKRDPEQGEYVVHLLVKGEQGSSSSTPAGGAGHRRGVSMDSAAPAPGPPIQPPPHIQQHQQQNLVAQHLRHQQQILQQMAQRNGGGGGGGMLPQQQMPPGIPMPPNFAQMIAQGQQQRAAMGMQGLPVHPQQPPQQQQNEATPPTPTSGQEPGQQQNAPTQPPVTNGQPLQPGQQQPQHRPVSGQGFHFEGIGPNGQRVQIHQQTLQIPHPGIPGQQPLFGGMPMMPAFGPQAGGQLFGQQPGGGGLFGHPQQPQGPSLFGQPPQPQPGSLFGNPPAQPAGPSALDRARENLAEMRRMLDEMRDSSGAATEEQRNRIASLQERTRSVNAYVDPFGIGGNSASAGGLFGNGGRRSASPNTAAAGTTGQPQRSIFNPNNIPSIFANPPLPQQQQQQQPSNPNDVTCYLLSGPQGPQALLFSPQHGTYTGQLANSGLRPTPTTQNMPATTTGQTSDRAPGLVQRPPAGGPQDPVAAAAAQHLAAGAAANAGRGGLPHPPPPPPAAHPHAHAHPPAQPQDPLGPMQGLLNHLWLLLRVLIFAYFILGSNLGWQRPLALLVIGFGFWAVRAGVLGDGGVVRGWWEGVVGVGPARPPPQGQAEDGAQGGAGDAAPRQAGEGQEGARQPMPTPAQVAQRLVEQRDAQRDARVRQLRELVRPVERAVALFVASFWPGIGEAHVRARREEEERVRAEEEVAARRREEEEEEKRREEEEGKKEGEGSGGKGENGAEDVGNAGEKGESVEAATGGVGGAEEEKVEGESAGAA